mgnify:CR=1 FL=1
MDKIPPQNIVSEEDIEVIRMKFKNPNDHQYIDNLEWYFQCPSCKTLVVSLDYRKNGTVSVPHKWNYDTSLEYTEEIYYEFTCCGHLEYDRICDRIKIVCQPNEFLKNYGSEPC